MFTAPVSNYTKTLWYNTYDVTQLICRGENVLAVICGNGWYNEVFSTPWKFNEAEWRDIPKFILKLTINGENVLVSDNEWKCKPNSAIIYNQLRSGEHFDSRLFDENWTEYSFDDSTWEYAVKGVNPPKGIFRECLCEPIHECELYPARNIIKTDEDGFISFGLDDWSAPIKERKVYAPFVNALLKIKFLRIAIMSARLSNHDESAFVKMLEQERSLITGKFIDECGICRINEQPDMRRWR